MQRADRQGGPLCAVEGSGDPPVQLDVHNSIYDQERATQNVEISFATRSLIYTAREHGWLATRLR